jgi:hypothetical protein
MIETRNGSGDVLQQYVWGLTYIDELVQVGVNTEGWQGVQLRCTRNERGQSTCGPGRVQNLHLW